SSRPIGARDARHVGKFDRQRDDALLQRADLLDMADQQRRSGVHQPGTLLNRSGFDATSLWHFDAAEQAPYTASLADIKRANSRRIRRSELCQEQITGGSVLLPLLPKSAE